MPTYEKRGDAWRAKVRIAGHPSQSETFPTKARAVAWAMKTEADLKDGKAGLAKRTFQQAIDRYVKEVCPKHRSGDNEEKRLKALARILPVTVDIGKLHAKDFAEFRDARLADVKASTVRKEMGILRGVLEAARRDWGWIRVNPIMDVKRPASPPTRRRTATDDEIRRILLSLGHDEKPRTMSQQVAAAVLIALETGMRAGELVGLEWNRVHLEARYVTLPLTKNGDARDVPLSTTAVALIDAMRGLDKAKVFTLTAASLDALFRKARDRCKIEGLTFHDLRHTAATRIGLRVKSGELSVLDFCRMFGWRDTKMALVYYNASASEIAQRLG